MPHRRHPRPAGARQHAANGAPRAVRTVGIELRVIIAGISTGGSTSTIAIVIAIAVIINIDRRLGDVPRAIGGAPQGVHFPARPREPPQPAGFATGSTGSTKCDGIVTRRILGVPAMT